MANLLTLQFTRFRLGVSVGLGVLLPSLLGFDEMTRVICFGMDAQTVTAGTQHCPYALLRFALATCVDDNSQRGLVAIAILLP